MSIYNFRCLPEIRSFQSVSWHFLFCTVTKMHILLFLCLHIAPIKSFTVFFWCSSVSRPSQPETASPAFMNAITRHFVLSQGRHCNINAYFKQLFIPGPAVCENGCTALAAKLHRGQHPIPRTMAFAIFACRPRKRANGALAVRVSQRVSSNKRVAWRYGAWFGADRGSARSRPAASACRA